MEDKIIEKLCRQHAHSQPTNKNSFILHLISKV